jgi:AraC family transcriptional regulator
MRLAAAIVGATEGRRFCAHLPPKGAEDKPIAISADLVSLHVSVIDKKGRFLPGLDRGAFAVYEDGVMNVMDIMEKTHDLKNYKGRKPMTTPIDCGSSLEDGGWLRQCNLIGFKLTEVYHPAGFERARHTHAQASFHFSFHGGCIEYEGRRVRESKLFTLSFQPPGHEHSCRCFKEGLRSLSLEMERDWMSRLRDYSIHLDQPESFQSPQIQWLTARLRRELAVMDQASPLVIEALALELAVEAARCQLKSSEQHWPGWLSRAKEFLHAHYREALSLRDVARAAGVHPVHLARTFRQHFHCTVGEYVRGLRIEFACQQIGHADASLPEIAVAAGFYDQSQFSRAFKRVMGVTPTEFRGGLRSR